MPWAFTDIIFSLVVLERREHVFSLQESRWGTGYMQSHFLIGDFWLMDSVLLPTLLPSSIRDSLCYQQPLTLWLSSATDWIFLSLSLTLNLCIFFSVVHVWARTHNFLFCQRWQWINPVFSFSRNPLQWPWQWLRESGLESDCLGCNSRFTVYQLRKQINSSELSFLVWKMKSSSIFLIYQADAIFLR